jgi:hypothetical protein
MIQMLEDKTQTRVTVAVLTAIFFAPAVSFVMLAFNQPLMWVLAPFIVVFIQSILMTIWKNSKLRVSTISVESDVIRLKRQNGQEVELPRSELSSGQLHGTVIILKRDRFRLGIPVHCLPDTPETRELLAIVGAKNNFRRETAASKAFGFIIGSIPIIFCAVVWIVAFYLSEASFFPEWFVAVAQLAFCSSIPVGLLTGFVIRSYSLLLIRSAGFRLFRKFRQNPCLRFPSLVIAGYTLCSVWGISSMGEHLLCKQGVRGSSPLSSTKPSHRHRPLHVYRGLFIEASALYGFQFIF